jgi:cobalamin biosynthesis Mg chelatase CobN
LGSERTSARERSVRNSIDGRTTSNRERSPKGTGANRERTSSVSKHQRNEPTASKQVERLAKTKKRVKSVEQIQNEKERNRIYIRSMLLRILLVLVLMIALFFIGTMIGYGGIGGGNPMDALKPESWEHLFHLFN